MKTIRTILIAISTLTAVLAFATSANAATTTVKLHTDADVSKFLADSASGIATMAKSNPSDNLQKWRRTDTSSGYAVYKNVQTGRCLTGRGIIGFPVVSVQACKTGALDQQWRLNVTKDFQLRLNGAAMKHNLAGNGTGVIMALFNGRNEMKWHTHAA
jgi:hypothetical protein